jgi:sterol desaturase/sphingolipid hydroxylase (fatty acid hydroxylase superfamily)
MMFDFSHVFTATILLTVASICLSAVGSFIGFHQQGGGSVRDFWRYLCPRDLFTRRSCYQDVGFIFIKQLVRPWVAAPFLLLTSVNCAVFSYRLLALAFGHHPQAEMPVALFVGLLIISVLIQDFLRFGSHYWLHKIGALWDVHKVHHSASFLTPLTNHRVHIIEEIIQQAVTGLSIGPFLAIAAFVTDTSISTNAVLGFDAYVLIDTLSFGILRHSHIGLSYGKLEHFLMSPKQHHMHHSIEERHWDRNFGFLLSCWDQLAGTICYSDPKERIRVGISAEETVDYGSVLKLHFMPYLKLFRRLPRFEKTGPAAISTDIGAETVLKI